MDPTLRKRANDFGRDWSVAADIRGSAEGDRLKWTVTQRAVVSQLGLLSIVENKMATKKKTAKKTTAKKKTTKKASKKK